MTLSEDKRFEARFNQYTLCAGQTETEMWDVYIRDFLTGKCTDAYPLPAGDITSLRRSGTIENADALNRMWDGDEFDELEATMAAMQFGWHMMLPLTPPIAGGILGMQYMVKGG